LAKDDDFNTAREQAKGRVAKLQAVGLTATSTSFNSLPWAPEADFTAQHATFEAIAKAAKPATPPPATETASAGTKPNGFIGGNQAPSSVRFLC
ncbi:MAG TPA: hypothetical protein VNU68_07540, partial [Verrucomicrobiae bacterium]|nr:hypothetical protein [Verrucomicrobiae bacterium]